MSEITRRQNATAFSEKNVKQIAQSAVTLLTLWTVSLAARLKLDPELCVPGHPSPPSRVAIGSLHGPEYRVSSTFRTYLGWAWFVAQLIPCVQIGLACLPLLRAKDDLSDIPLTAAQRKLLGLAPSSAPPTPDAKFSTPPRYSRTPSVAGSVGSRGSYASSPLSGRGSPAVQGGFGTPGSKYSPAGSPLYQKTMNGFTNARRSSLGSSTPFGQSTSTDLFSDPGPPSPSGGKRTSVGLNSKWLYEKGRRSSGTARLY